MVDDKHKNKLTLAAEIIGIIGGLISIISFISPLFGINTNILFGLFNLNPIYSIALFIISILILVTVAIRKEMNQGKTDIVKHWHFTTHKTVCFIKAYDMKWDVEIPEEKSRSLINIYNFFDIPENPKCEKCDTKLEYHDNILWYTYSCFNCSFKKRTWINLERLTDRVNEDFKVEIKNRIKRKN